MAIRKDRFSCKLVTMMSISTKTALDSILPVAVLISFSGEFAVTAPCVQGVSGVFDPRCTKDIIMCVEHSSMKNIFQLN